MYLHELKAALDGSLLTSNSAPVFVTNFMFFLIGQAIIFHIYGGP
jgi:hypothetical protein